MNKIFVFQRMVCLNRYRLVNGHNVWHCDDLLQPNHHVGAVFSRHVVHFKAAMVIMWQLVEHSTMFHSQ